MALLRNTSTACAMRPISSSLRRTGTATLWSPAASRRMASVMPTIGRTKPRASSHPAKPAILGLFVLVFVWLTVTVWFGVVVVTSLAGWMLGSLAGYAVGLRGGRALLDHPGRLQDRRRKLLAKGDAAFGRHTFTASVTLPAFVSGIFRVRLWLFLLGALVAGIFWVGMYVGLSYFLGEEVAKRIGAAGTKALIWVIVLVVIGLAARAGWSRWRARHHEQAASA